MACRAAMAVAAVGLVMSGTLCFLWGDWGCCGVYAPGPAPYPKVGLSHGHEQQESRGACTTLLIACLFSIVIRQFEEEDYTNQVS